MTLGDLADTFLVAGGAAIVLSVVLGFFLAGTSIQLPGKSWNMEDEKRVAFGGIFGFIKKLTIFGAACLLIGGLFRVVVWVRGLQ